MKIVSVINYKGGVGKTTLTANLSAELAHRGYKILMVDLDPQASLTFSFISADKWLADFASSCTIRNWFEYDNRTNDFCSIIIDNLMVGSYVKDNGGCLHLVASHLDLINVDLTLAMHLNGADPKQIRQNYLKTHYRLAEGLAQLSDSQYDIVLIDCPPNFNVVTKNAIVASTDILIPAKPDYLSTLGIDYLKRSVTRLGEDYNEYCSQEISKMYAPINPHISGIIFTMVQYYRGRPIAALRPFITQTVSENSEVFGNMIRENKTVFSDAGTYGTPVAIMKPGDRPNVVRDLEMVTDEFITKIIV